jgi:threonine dehydrogenase-like Zn-dependent dehydrogenase
VRGLDRRDAGLACGVVGHVEGLEPGRAVEALAKRSIYIVPLLTPRFPINRARQAFELAGDRSRAMKVQITF